MRAGVAGIRGIAGIAGVPNLRDAGGHPTRAGGRIRRGLAYRSSALHRLAGADARAFARLRIRSVYDLRSSAEREARPDRLPPGTEYVVAEIVTSFIGREFDWFGDPEAVRARLGRGRAQAISAGQYRELVTLPGASAAYGRLFRDLASPEHWPALFHCSTGKDRTGWAAAVLLLLLGVPDDVVLADYLESGSHLGPLVEPILGEFGANGCDPELLRPIFSVSPAYLRAGLAELRDRFGTVEEYFATALGVDAAAQAALRQAFVEPAGRPPEPADP